VTRLWHWLMFTGLATWGCGPDSRDCSAQKADFYITLELKDRPLSTDTVVHVTYGGSGMEDYSPSEHGVTHEVVFCTPEHADGGVERLDASVAEAGASGSDDTGVDRIVCQLWTGGYAKLEVRTSGLDPVTYDLSPRQHSCTVTQTFVLDSPDAG